MGSYQDALASLPSDRMRDEIEDFMNQWSHTGCGIYISPNIDRESFLPPDRLALILEAVHAHRTEPVEVVEQYYEKACYNHVRQDGVIPLHALPTYVGRTVSRAEFMKYLTGSHHYSRRKAERLINKLLLGHPLDPFEERILMSQYSAWVTWNAENPSRNPFDFARNPNRAEKIRANLGLERKRRSDALLLFVYHTRPETPLHRPTIADAALHPFFQPARQHEPHGWTRPWPIQFLRDHGINHTPRPRPEAVHKPEEMRSIQSVTIAT